MLYVTRWQTGKRDHATGESFVTFIILPLFCLMLSRGHRKANPTGPLQVVIPPGFLN